MNARKTTTGKWNDKKYRQEYGKKWREQKKLEKSSPSALMEQAVTNKPLSAWAAKKAERQAREDATKAHPLGLESCPFCSAAFFRKIGETYEPIKMDHCDPCGKRFWYYNGVKL